VKPPASKKKKKVKEEDDDYDDDEEDFKVTQHLQPGLPDDSFWQFFGAFWRALEQKILVYMLSIWNIL
jgi:hypothetical protein